jgi:hypothetical protein
MNMDVDPAVGATSAYQGCPQLAVVEDGVSFEHTDGIGSAQDGGEVMRLVDVLEKNRQVRLPPVENLPDALESLGSHGIVRCSLRE